MYVSRSTATYRQSQLTNLKHTYSHDHIPVLQICLWLSGNIGPLDDSIAELAWFTGWPV